MKTATRFRMVQWARFQDETMKLFGSTLFTGVNGSGKSTVLDAMTYLLCGNREFNKAARDRDRTVKAYVRGDTKSNGTDRYLRTGAVISYLAMEFFSEADNRCFVAGVCIESPDEASDCKSSWFVLPATTLDDVILTKREGMQLTVLPKNEMTVSGKTLKTASFLGREKAMSQMMRVLGIRSDAMKYRSKLVKMMAFNPENNIDRFIQDCVLEPGKVDSLKELREQKKKFEHLKEMYETLRLSRQRLIELETATANYEAKRSLLTNRQMMLAYQHYRDRCEEKENIEYRSRAAQEKKKAHESEKEEIERRLAQATERYHTAKSNNTFGDTERSIEEITRQILAAEQAAAHYETGVRTLEALKEKLTGLLGAYDGREEEYADAETEKVVFALPDTTCGAEEKRARVMDLARRFAIQKDALHETRTRTKDRISLLKQQLAETEKELKALHNNLMTWPEEAVSVRDAIRREFEKRGIQTQVRLFAELVSNITDPAWRAAIETFLGKKRFNIIVDGAYCAEALQILHDKKLHGTNVVITDKLPDTEVAAHSAAAVLDIPNIFARRYANYLLNGIRLCDTVEELHNYPAGALTKDGMLAKSYAASMMQMKRTRFYLGAEAIRLQITQLKREQEETSRQLTEVQSEADETRRLIDQIEAVDWNTENYLFDAPQSLNKTKAELSDLTFEKEKLENDPAFQALLEEQTRAKKQMDEIGMERDRVIGDIRECDNLLATENEKRKSIAGEIFTAQQAYEEIRIKNLELEQAMLADYERMRKRSGNPVVIREKSVRDIENDMRNAEKAMEDLQIACAKLNELDPGKRGPSFIPFYRAMYADVSNVKIEETSSRLREESKKLESAFMNDFVAEINEMIMTAKEEIDLINRELKRLPFGNDIYSFRMEERGDRREFFRICRKLEQYGSMELYEGTMRHDEELEHDIAQFMSVILEEEDETEYTDYRKYFTYDMRIVTRQGKSETEADLSRKQGSASGGEKQTPYFIILAASLMQCYPKNADSVRLAFIDEAFSALSRERIEQMVRYFEDNRFQVIYAAPPEKIGSIGTFIRSTVSLVVSGKYTHTVEGMMNTDLKYQNEKTADAYGQ